MKWYAKQNSKLCLPFFAETGFSAGSSVPSIVEYKHIHHLWYSGVMRDFFKGWRRKAGVIALMMACATSTMWIRSRSIQEHLRIPGDNFTQIFVVSSEEGLVGYYFRDVETRKNRRLITRWYFRPKLPDRYPADFFTYLDIIDWNVDIAGFYLAECHSKYDTRGIAIIPFWLIACPLTVLSTVLLLWPQRKSKT